MYLILVWPLKVYINLNNVALFWGNLGENTIAATPWTGNVAHFSLSLLLGNFSLKKNIKVLQSGVSGQGNRDRK